MKLKIVELPGIKTDNINFNRIIMIIQLSGIVDMDRSDDLLILLTCLISGGLKKIIFDMTGVDFIDSYGIGTLIDITKLIRKNKDGDAVLTNVPDRIHIIFKPINLQKFIKIFSTNDDALHYFRYV